MIYLQLTPPVLTISIPHSIFTVKPYVITFKPTRTLLFLLWPFACLGTQLWMLFPLSFSFIWLMLIHPLVIHRNEGVSFIQLDFGGNISSASTVMFSWVLKIVALWSWYLMVPSSSKWTLWFYWDFNPDYIYNMYIIFEIIIVIGT